MDPSRRLSEAQASLHHGCPPPSPPPWRLSQGQERDLRPCQGLLVVVVVLGEGEEDEEEVLND